MFYGLIILIIVQQVNFIGCQIIPDVQCPDIFEYVYDGYKWSALITVPTPDVNKVVMTVNFTVGEIGFDNIAKLNLIDPDNAIKNIENYRPFKYTVILPRTKKIPQVTEITYNGNVMCHGPGLDPPSTSFWLTHIYTWYSSAITFPRKPNNSQQSNNYPQQSNNNQQQSINPQQPFYPNQQNNYYPQQPNYPQNNYAQHNNNPQQSNNNYPQQPNNNYPQQPNNNNPQQPNNNPQQPINIPLEPINQPPVQQPTTNNILPQNPPKSKNKKNKYKNTQSCGMIRNKRNTDDQDVVPFIYNGTPIARNNHPWLTALYDKDAGTFNFFCGGNLISNKHVLTAAHCTISKKNIQVKVGAHNSQELFDVGAVYRDAIKITNHEEYAPGSAHADISLLLLDEEVEFIATIKPICLWNKEDDINAIIGRSGTIMGWGLQENGDQSSTPLQTDIKIASQQQCRSVEILKNSISDMTFCAGTKGNGPCMGDSGGGLFLRNRGRWYLRGIISVSIANRRLNLCDVNTYAVYVDTAKYVDWIVDNMK